MTSTTHMQITLGIFILILSKNEWAKPWCFRRNFVETGNKCENIVFRCFQIWNADLAGFQMVYHTWELNESLYLKIRCVMCHSVCFYWSIYNFIGLYLWYLTCDFAQVFWRSWGLYRASQLERFVNASNAGVCVCMLLSRSTLSTLFFRINCVATCTVVISMKLWTIIYYSISKTYTKLCW